MHSARVALLWIVVGTAAILLAQALALAGMGHPWLCTCGEVKVWHGAVDTQNSQHLFDWYTFSHVGHGILFFLLTLGLRRRFDWARRVPLGVWLVWWVGVEAMWEVFENTPEIISHYRTNPISKHYFGDSVLNSLGDTLTMGVGFVLSVRVGAVWALVGLVGMEVWTYLAIGDSLLQNVLFFLESAVKVIFA